MARKTPSLTEGKVSTALLRFALPFLAANILQALYGAIDFLIIGRFCSSPQLAAVSVSSQVMVTLLSLIIGVSTGSTEEIIIKGRPIAKNGEIVVLSAVATASRDVNESLSVSALTSTSVISVWWADSGKYFPAGTTVSLRGK